MPELPEVETVVRDVRPGTVGRVIRKVVRASPLMAKSTVGSFRTKLAGRRVAALERQGKWMFFRLDDGNTLVIHLGMTGNLRVVPVATPLSKHCHLRLTLDDGAEELRFADPRRFGELLLFSPETFAERFGPDRLGPDATVITLAQLRAALARTGRPLKAFLLDQRGLAGVGNIYADEILFAARLSPARRGNALAAAESARLHRSLRAVLRRAIRYNGTSIRDYVTGRGAPGEFQDHLMVYGRAKSPCKKCASPIELVRTIVVGRATHWCPVCQKDEG